jgi:flagellum-specific peptidoglycan hydrolase FlgJ
MSTFIGTREEFTKMYSSYISAICQDTGLFPGTVIAQAIIESSGKYNGQWSVGGSGLSRKANNYFGIKCGTGWKGRTFNASTGEYTPSGEKYTTVSCFRAYDSVEDSIKDHLNFLQKNPRYKKNGVFNSKNVAEQAAALKRAGYATAPNYAATIVSVYNSIKPFISQEKKKLSNKQIKLFAIPSIFLLIIYFLNKKKLL